MSNKKNQSPIVPGAKGGLFVSYQREGKEHFGLVYHKEQSNSAYIKHRRVIVHRVNKNMQPVRDPKSNKKLVTIISEREMSVRGYLD